MPVMIYNNGKQPAAGNPSLRLFCFPHAGGSAHIYRSWQRFLPSEIEVCPVEIPGRGMLMHQDAYTKLPALVEHIASELHPHFSVPFAFFGHSMGSLISFELARYLRRHNAVAPVYLFVSGNTAPQLPRQKPPMYNLGHQEFLDALHSLNGTPEEILENPELMQLMVPLLRADFEMVETYQYRPELPLDCPIAAFGGFEDQDAEQEELQSWELQTTEAFSLDMFSGDHFFLRAVQPLLLEKIRTKLERSSVAVR